MDIETYLGTAVLMDGVKVVPTTLPIEKQLEFLIQTNFPLLAAPHSKLWRVEHCYYIINKSAQKVLFALNRAQRDFVINKLGKGYKRLIILKARQLGFTTLIAIWFLDEIIFNRNTEAMQIAHTLKDAGELFNKKVKYAVSNLPAPIRAILTMGTSRANRIQFDYPDKSTSAISVSNSARSGTYPLLHISELAKLAKLYPDRADEVITGTLPAVPMNGTAIIESTAEGMTGIFHDMFDNGWKRRHIITPAMSKAEFYPVFYNWQWDDEQIAQSVTDGVIPITSMEECEIDWEQYKNDNELTAVELSFYYTKYIQLNRDIDKLHQEFPTTPTEAFIGTGSNFFSLKKIYQFTEAIDDTKWMRHTYMSNDTGGELYADKQGDWWIKDHAEPGHTYVVGGDIAQGLETGDYTTLAVIGLDKQIKAFYRGHCEPDEASRMAQFIGRRYNTALLVIEKNADGNWVNTDIVNSLYPNIYLQTSFDDITKTMTRTYGWATNVNTRKNMLDNMKVWFSMQGELNCRLLLEEMLVFVRNKRGKPMAMGDNHDDLIIAVAIALIVIGVRKDNIKTDKPKTLMEYIFAH